jgi:hypothetical protein
MKDAIVLGFHGTDGSSMIGTTPRPFYLHYKASFERLALGLEYIQEDAKGPNVDVSGMKFKNWEIYLDFILSERIVVRYYTPRTIGCQDYFFSRSINPPQPILTLHSPRKSTLEDAIYLGVR